MTRWLDALSEELAGVVRELPTMDFENPTALRRAMSAASSRGGPKMMRSDVKVEDHRIARDSGGDLTIRVYRPAGATPTSVLLWFHGGGYCIGGLDGDDCLCAELAAGSGALVASVDYRLAPEHPYPAAFNDGWLALRSVGAEVQTPRIAVGGMSAGAGLAAALARRAGESKLRLVHQVLVCPFLDDRLETNSMRSLADAPVFTAKDAAAAWRHYLSSTGGTTPLEAAPSRATRLGCGPPAYVLVAAIDCLRDEGVAYALALLDAGVPTELRVVPAAPHGFVNLAPNASQSRRSLAEICEVLRSAFAGAAP